MNYYESSKNRANKMFVEIEASEAQHKMINSATDHCELQDLYINKFYEWLKHPKCQIVFDSIGVGFYE